MLLAEFQQYFFGFSIFVTSLFLVLLVLVQRGRGGGLTGALGGAGGQSAFGTKAGDLFTKITVGVAAVWIFLCAAAVFFLGDRALPQTGVLDQNIPSASGSAAGTPAADSAGAEAGTTMPAAEVPAAEVPAAEVPAAEVPAPESPAATASESTGTQAEITDPSELTAPAPRDSSAPSDSSATPAPQPEGQPAAPAAASTAAPAAPAANNN